MPEGSKLVKISPHGCSFWSRTAQLEIELPDGTPKRIVRHSLRHTGVTWLALAGVDPYEICKFAGLTMETFERVYSHHHPDFMSGIKNAQSGKPRKPKD